MNASWDLIFVVHGLLLPLLRRSDTNHHPSQSRLQPGSHIFTLKRMSQSLCYSSERRPRLCMVLHTVFKERTGSGGCQDFWCWLSCGYLCTLLGLTGLLTVFLGFSQKGVTLHNTESVSLSGEGPAGFPYLPRCLS